MHRLFYGVFFLVFALGTAIASASSHALRLFGAALCSLLLSKGVFWMMIYYNKKRHNTDESTTLRNGFHLLAAGQLLSALLFLVSAIRGEWWFGYLAAPIFLSTAIGMEFAAKRTETTETTRCQGTS